jgi:hypothetical protein
MQLKGVQLIGGHYIGLFATFDSLNGKHIPIDERYIPSSLLEWGYPPATLELLVSETAFSLDESGSTDSTPKPSTLIRMMRSVSTIMPATGCDVDNLETVQANEEWNSAQMFCSHHKEDGQDFFSAASIISVLPRSANSQPNIRLESCFSWPLLDESQNPGQNAVYDSSPLVAKEPLDSNQYRTRISVDLGHALFSDDKDRIPNGWKFISPIRISLERQLLTLAETAAFASRGGGLDARTSSIPAGAGGTLTCLAKASMELTLSTIAPIRMVLPTSLALGATASSYRFAHCPWNHEVGESAKNSGHLDDAPLNHLYHAIGRWVSGGRTSRLFLDCQEVCAARQDGRVANPYLSTALAYVLSTGIGFVAEI